MRWLRDAMVTCSGHMSHLPLVEDKLLGVHPSIHPYMLSADENVDNRCYGPRYDVIDLWKLRILRTSFPLSAMDFQEYI